MVRVSVDEGQSLLLDPLLYLSKDLVILRRRTAELLT